MLALLDALPAAIVFVDDGRIVRWNVAASSLYGWSAHETIGQPFDTLLFDDSDRDEVRAIIDRAKDRGRWEGNFRVKRRDGMLLVSSFTVSGVDAGDGRPCIAWIATDVVDQHLAEQERAVLLSTEHAVRQELESTVGVFEALLESAPIGIAVLDLELFFTQANATFTRFLGIDGSPVGGYLDDLVSLPPEVAADLRRVVTTGRSLMDRKLELKSHGDAGARRDISANYFPIFSSRDRPTGAGLTWTDVTAARLAEGERAELTQRATDAQRRLAVLAAASSVLMTSTDVDALIERLSRVLAPAAADWCVIELVGKAGLIDHAAVAHSDKELAGRLRATLLNQVGENSAEAPTAVTRRTGQALLLNGDEVKIALALAARSDEQALVLDEMGLRSGVIVPIKSRGEYLGILSLWNSSAVEMGDDDLDIAVEVAHRAALSVGRAITYRNEHRLAEQLQQALLPAALPVVDATRIEVRYSAAADSATVGGDWYDVFQLAHNMSVLSVGDVVGHDTQAAVGMSRIRYLINAFAVEGVDASTGPPRPDEILRRIDRIVYPDLSAWATCVVALLDSATGELRWSTAGHPPPFLVRDGTVRALDAANGTMLGVAPDRARVTASIQLYANDRVLMYSDGLFERRGETIDAGLTRLAETVRMYATRPLDRFCDDVIRAMFTGVEQSDDIAMLAVDYLGH